MSVSPSEPASGRRGIRTHTPRREHALAMRPGQPYPAAFRIVYQFTRSTQADRCAVRTDCSAVGLGGMHNAARSCFLFNERVQVAGVGVEPTESPGSRPGRFARLRTRRSSGRSGSCTRQAEVMSLGWALAPLRQDSLSVTRGRFELPMPRPARRSERRVSANSTIRSENSMTRAGVEPALPA